MVRDRVPYRQETQFVAHGLQQGRQSVQGAADLQLEFQRLPPLLVYSCPMNSEHVTAVVSLHDRINKLCRSCSLAECQIEATEQPERSAGVRQKQHLCRVP